MRAKFEPKSDITAYELAQCVASFGGGARPKDGVQFQSAQWDGLPESLKRHFVPDEYWGRKSA